MTLVRNLFSTPLMRSSSLAGEKESIALLAALVFAVHPLMTEAVTYLVQRLLSLSALFFLVSVNCYLCARSGRLSKSRKNWALAAFLISCLLAFFTRENTWVLPLVLLVMEKTFFNQASGSRKWFSSLLVGNIVSFILIIIYSAWSHKYFKPIPPLETHTFTITLPVYYLTQVCVICSYLGLLFFPSGQVFDRDFPVVFSISDPRVIVCSLILAACVISMITLRKKQPMLFFSLFWFLVTILPQSLVPRPNVFFEHRLYLPSIGIFIFGVTLVTMAGRRYGKIPRLILVALVPVLMFLTISRNSVWSSELSMWKDTVGKSPGNARAWSNLGRAEYNLKNYPSAESDFNHAIQIVPRKAEFWYNLAFAQQMQNKPEQSLNSMSRAISIDPDKAMYYHDRGVIFAMTGNYPRAIFDFSKALSIQPGLRSALINRARVYDLMGDTILRNRDLHDAGY
jgi:hypothetical protein